jgi:salicylate hydroxylase
MLPYLAQGANSSLEDGAVLGRLLGHMKNKSHLPQILRLYESLRKSRGEAIVKETFKQVSLPSRSFRCNALTLLRDMISTCQMGRSRKGETRCSCLNLERRLRVHFRVGGEYSTFRHATSRLHDTRTCPEVQPWLYGYDAIKEVENAVMQHPELFARGSANM